LASSLRSLAALASSDASRTAPTAAAVSGALASLGDAALRLLTAAGRDLTPAQISGMAVG
jgi:hypothetical protein